MQARNSGGSNRRFPPRHSQGGKSFEAPCIDIDAYGPGVHIGIEQLVQLAYLRQQYKSTTMNTVDCEFQQHYTSMCVR